MQGIAGLPGTLGAAHADPTANQGVAGALAGAAVPPGPAPGTFGAQNITSGFSPFAKVLAGSYAADPGMANVGAGVNLGKDITTGPGTDFPTSNAIVTSQSTPQHIGAGDTLLINPTKGANAPGNVVTGQSPYDQKVSDTMAAAAPTDAKHTMDVGSLATVNLGKLAAVQNAYNTTVAPEYTPGGILSEKAALNAAAYFKLPVPEILKMGAPGVKDMIRKQFAGMIGDLRDNQGQPIIKGSLDTIMSQFPDPDSSPEQFHAAVQSLMTTLQQQAADGNSALQWYSKPTQQGYVNLLQQQSQHAAEAKAAFAAAGIQDAPSGGAGAGGAGGGGEGLRAPTPDELNQYHAAVAAGRNPAELKEIFSTRHHIDPSQLN